MEHGAVTPNSLSRALVGLAASTLATIPLATLVSLYGFFSSAEDHALTEVVLGAAVVVIFALPLSAVGGLVIGVPVYVLVSRTKGPRGAVLVAAAALTGVIIREFWLGGEPFDDIGSVGLFAFFGAYSGVAFWFGADVWSRN